MDIDATYKKVVEDWNAQADEHNQWSELGEDEKVAYAFFCGRLHAAEERLSEMELQEIG